jgi:cell division protein FtsB
LCLHGYTRLRELNRREADMKRWSAETPMAQTAAEREIVRREVEKLDATIDRLKKELTA